MTGVMCTAMVVDSCSGVSAPEPWLPCVTETRARCKGRVRCGRAKRMWFRANKPPARNTKCTQRATHNGQEQLARHKANAQWCPHTDLVVEGDGDGVGVLPVGVQHGAVRESLQTRARLLVGPDVLNLWTQAPMRLSQTERTLQRTQSAARTTRTPRLHAKQHGRALPMQQRNQDVPRRR